MCGSPLLEGGSEEGVTLGGAGGGGRAAFESPQHGLTSSPIHSLCFVFAVGGMSAQPPAPAAVFLCHDGLVALCIRKPN